MPDRIEVRTSCCARLCGRRAERALACAAQEDASGEPPGVPVRLRSLHPGGAGLGFPRGSPRRHRELDLRQPGSPHRAETRRRLTRAHPRVTPIRQDAWHLLTAKLARPAGIVVVETLRRRGAVA